MRTEESVVRERRTRNFLWVFGVGMVVTAGTAFVFKLSEFIYVATLPEDQGLVSFLLPVLNYLVVALGFASLFVWAYLRGEFRDVEKTKVRMLEMQDQIDRVEMAAAVAAARVRS